MTDSVAVGVARALNAMPIGEQVEYLSGYPMGALRRLLATGYDMPHLRDDRVPCVCGAGWRVRSDQALAMEHNDGCLYLDALDGPDNVVPFPRNAIADAMRRHPAGKGRPRDER